jgi:hypothetical protein
MIYDSSLLGCDASSVCKWFGEFPKKVLPSPSGAQIFITSEILLGVLYEVKKKVLCEDEDRLFVCPSVCPTVCLSHDIGGETNCRIYVINTTTLIHVSLSLTLY